MIWEHIHVLPTEFSSVQILTVAVLVIKSQGLINDAYFKNN